MDKANLRYRRASEQVRAIQNLQVSTHVCLPTVGVDKETELIRAYKSRAWKIGVEKKRDGSLNGRENEPIGSTRSLARFGGLDSFGQKWGRNDDDSFSLSLDYFNPDSLSPFPGENLIRSERAPILGRFDLIKFKRPLFSIAPLRFH